MTYLAQTWNSEIDFKPDRHIKSIFGSTGNKGAVLLLKPTTVHCKMDHMTQLPNSTTRKKNIWLPNFILIYTMALLVMEFQDQGYKIRKMFA